jgi:gas vesicle protein
MNNQANNNARTNQILVGVLCGAAIGAGIALLTAPASGAETRKRLADTTRQQFGRMRSRIGNLRKDFKDSVAHGVDEMRTAAPR